MHDLEAGKEMSKAHEKRGNNNEEDRPKRLDKKEVKEKSEKDKERDTGYDIDEDDCRNEAIKEKKKEEEMVDGKSLTVLEDLLKYTEDILHICRNKG